MKKFSLVLESNSEERNLLFNKISELKSWLYKSNGLGLMETIDSIFKENGWETKINFQEVANFNKGLDILRKTSIDQNWLNQRMQHKLPGGKIENASFVKDELGEWHPVNKLNTNYMDLSDMLSEMIIRSIEADPVKGRKACDDIINDTRTTLLSCKPQMKRLLGKYFITLGEGLDDFKKFTKYSKKFSSIGEATEDSIVDLLKENEFEISYQGGNGDFIDMIFGVDIIVFREDFGFKTIQVKTNIDWTGVQYYKVDWLGDKNKKIFDKQTRKEVDIVTNIDLFSIIDKTNPE
jgi:hypothetical protein